MKAGHIPAPAKILQPRNAFSATQYDDTSAKTMTYRIKSGEQPTTTQWEHLFKAVPIDSFQDENEVLLQRVTKYLDGSMLPL